MLSHGAARPLAVGGGPEMTEYPALCSVCGCPIQLLSDGYQGKTKGTIVDALRRHSEVVHPERMPE